jgi:hypothetical protein
MDLNKIARFHTNVILVMVDKVFHLVVKVSILHVVAASLQYHKILNIHPMLPNH